ncbi:hypothetical protein G7009_02025 [Pseudomonas capeferrum]|nr:hypothetical protein [Pseudomonas capeferrum]MBA1200575.1 hypothetical protein [Pseudomonas capeferrum]
MTRLACIPLIATVLLLAGCHSNHHRDDGWRDNDRKEHRQKRHHRQDRGDDERRYNDRGYR